MTDVGYKLSSEEHPPNDLVRYAQRAEAIGLKFGSISDHYHPWIDKQGHSPFVWNVVGAIAHATSNFPLMTGVTCPTMRVHPAIVAQAAATSAAMMPGRFSLGVGSGENLNEHILGDRWPSAGTRLEMLEEAIEVIRELWTGKLTNHSGRHYTIENARIYTLPDEPPRIMVAAGGANAGELAGRLGDGLISVGPDDEVIKAFEANGGTGKPRYAEVQVCWAATEEEAKKTAHEWWPNVGIKGQLTQELPLPAHFEQAAGMVSIDDLEGSVSWGPDPEAHVQGMRKFIDAGYDHLAVHQIGPDQDGFFDFYEREVLPRM
jgi:coenzyme F420-dependent glucose-6-phosphate dehydrogenase